MTEILHRTLRHAGDQHQCQWSQHERREGEHQHRDVLRGFTHTHTHKLSLKIQGCLVRPQWFLCVSQLFTYVHVSVGSSSGSGVGDGLHADVVVTRRQILQGVKSSVGRQRD